MRDRVVRLIAAAAVAAPLLVPTTGEVRAQEVVVEERIGTEYQPLRLVRVAEIENPWGVAPLPDGRLLVTERSGRLLLIADGTAAEVAGVPRVHAQSQGGLLDVVLHPDHARNGWIYLTYSRGDSSATVPALVRARLEGNRLVALEDLFESNTPTSPGRHYGSRVLFLSDGTLLMTIGDRGANPERAQDTRDHSGTIVRLNDDGSVPADNPFVSDPAYAQEIYTYGHRNIQGIVRHPVTGDVWVTEHGPRGSDELNRIVAGQNYGWPVASLGRDYRTQEQFGRREWGPGLTPPVFEFLPTLAPSGLAVVQGGGFDARWQGNLLAGGLRAQRILRLVIENRQVVHAEELLLRTVGRIRDVRQAADGAIYVASEGDRGGIYRLEPAG